MIKLPLNGNWTQENSSDRLGSLASTKNITLDKTGYLKLSPRSVNIFDDSSDTTNISDTDFNIPVAFGRYGNGTFRMATTDEPFNISLSATAKTITEDETSNNPDLNFQSHGVWWQNRFHESTDTGVSYNASGTWTANAITGLTSGKRHYLEVFASRTQLCVSNGNVVKQYNTSYANTTDLTIPSDYEITGLAYNNSRLGIITRLGGDSEGQNAESRFYVWDGAGTAANSDAGVGAYATLAITSYKTSFVIITSAGKLLYWNGGGFDELGSFPFSFDRLAWGDLLNHFAYGDNMIIDGDNILINLGFDLKGISKKLEEYLPQNPSGVWCYTPGIGLHHKYSPSNSKAYLHTISEANVNTTTDLFTTTSTIPETGNPAIMPSATIGGLNINQVYYVIKVSDTTFRLAETKAKALSGDYETITSASSLNYLWLYDIKDYGITYFEKAGAVALFGTTSSVYRDIIFGARLLDGNLTTQPTLCMCVPHLKNIGYAVSPKLFLNSDVEKIANIVVKHRPLGTSDKIIVKAKDKTIYGLPTTSPNISAQDELIWTSRTSAYTQTDLSEAKTAIDGGEELELEITAGVGAGQLIQIDSIDTEDGVYVVNLKEEIEGYVQGGRSHFSIDNWILCGEIDSTTQKDGVFDCPVAVSGKSVQFKIILEGYETTIEDVLINNTRQEA